MIPVLYAAAKLTAMAVVAVAVFVTDADAANYNENYFNKEVCTHFNGDSSYRINVAGSYIEPDCLTAYNATEADWGDKAWKEGVGQALTYAALTKRVPAIFVYIRTESEKLRKKDERGLAILEAADLGIGIEVVYVNRDTGEWHFKKYSVLDEVINSCPQHYHVAHHDYDDPCHTH